MPNSSPSGSSTYRIGTNLALPQTGGFGQGTTLTSPFAKKPKAPLTWTISCCPTTTGGGGTPAGGGSALGGGK